MKQYQIYELTFKGKEPEGDFVNVDIKGVFQVNGKKYVSTDFTMEKKITGFVICH